MGSQSPDGPFPMENLESSSQEEIDEVGQTQASAPAADDAQCHVQKPSAVARAILHLKMEQEMGACSQ